MRCVLIHDTAITADERTNVKFTFMFFKCFRTLTLAAMKYYQSFFFAVKNMLRCLNSFILHSMCKWTT